MAVAFDAVGPSSAGTSASGSATLTWAHTCGATANYLTVVTVENNSQGADTCTYNGVSMTLLAEVYSNQAGGGAGGYVSFWGLASPATGASLNVVYTSHAASGVHIGGSVSYSGVGSVGTPVTGSSNGSVASFTISVNGTTNGGMVAAGACAGSAMSTPTQTGRWLDNVDGNTSADNGAQQDAASTGSTVSLGWSIGGSGDSYGVVAVELLPSAASLSPSVPLLIPPGRLSPMAFPFYQPSPPVQTPVAAPVAPPNKAVASHPYARKGASSGSSGSPWRPWPSPFRQPSPVKGATARKGAQAGSPGAPRLPWPSPFRQSQPIRGRSGAKTGQAHAPAPFSPITPSLFHVPGKPATGKPAIRKGISAGSSGAKWVFVAPGIPALFAQPGKPAIGKPAARKGFAAGSPGAPRQPRPSLFLQPQPIRGHAAARAGHALASSFTLVILPRFIQPGKSITGKPAARKGADYGSSGAPRVPWPSPFRQSQPVRGFAAARKGNTAGSPGAKWIFVPIIPAPFFIPHLPIRGIAAARRGGSKGGQGILSALGIPFLIDAGLGGSATAIDFRGQAQAIGFSGVAANQATINGGTNDQNMAAMQNLVALQGNDASFALVLTQFNVPLNLTGLTIKLYVKATETTPDSSATIYTVGSGLTVTAALGGDITWILPHTATTTPGQTWWRVDVIGAGGSVGTCIYGNLYIVAV